MSSVLSRTIPLIGSAKKIRDLVPPRVGMTQAHYFVDPPLVDFFEERSYENVVVSNNGDEVYIFGANPSGEIIDWIDLPGSASGVRPDAEALGFAGYATIA